LIVVIEKNEIKIEKIENVYLINYMLISYAIFFNS